MLIQNITRYLKETCTRSGAYTVANERVMWGLTLLNAKNRFVGQAGISQLKANPDGYNPHYAFYMNNQAGDMSMGGYGGLSAATISTANLAGGKNIDSTVYVSGNITAASVGLIIEMLAALTTSSNIYTANLAGMLEMISTLYATGDVDAAMGAIVDMISEISSSGTLSTAQLTALAYISALIAGDATINETMIKNAVWNAATVDYDESGTMGQKMNSAGSAGDPWTATFPGNYTSNQFGGALYKLYKLTKNIFGKVFS